MERLNGLFKRAGIKHIVSVDDCFMQEVDEGLLRIQDHMATHLKTAICFLRENGEDIFADTLEKLPEEDKNDYIEEICKNLADEAIRQYSDQHLTKKLSAEKTAMLSFLNELKNSGCIESYFALNSHSEAQQFYDDMSSRIPDLSSNTVLWMIDKDLTVSGGSPDGGIDLIKNFLTINKYKSVFALTSAQLGGLNDENFRHSILETLQPYQSLQACVVNKDTILEKKFEELYQQISNGIRHNSSGNILQYISDMFKAATNSANTSVNALGNDTVYRVFFESGKAEGISPMDVFRRLLLIILKDDIIKNMAEKYDDIAKLVYEYRQICEWCDYEALNKSDYAIIRKARTSECYDEYINQRYMPVSSGDVFIVNNEPFFVIGQACDLTIRDDGSRKNQCATLARILPESQNNSQAKYPLAYYREGSEWCINFNDTITIDFNVLDLCTLNSDGFARLSREFSLSDVEFRYTESVLRKLKQVVAYNLSIIKKYDEAEQLYKNHDISFIDLCDSIRNIFQDNSVLVKPSFSNGDIEYNIRREKRVAETITDDIIKQYSDHLARKALDYDFAKEYQYMVFKILYPFDLKRLGLSEGQLKALEIPGFSYYKNKKMKEDDLKKQVASSFSDEYRQMGLHKGQCPTGTVCKCDTKKKTITVLESYIPVKINGERVYSVFNYSSDKISITIPMHFIPGLKNKQNMTYQCEDGTKIVVSNSGIKFVLNDDCALTFFNDQLLEHQVQLVFDTSQNNLQLQITCIE